MSKQLDLMEIKKAITCGKLEVYVSSFMIYLRDVVSGEVIQIGEVKVK